MLAFQAQGHRVISLSQAEGEPIHGFLRSKGIETYSHVIRSGSNVIYFLKHIIYLTRFCRRHKVDVVYSHLEPANFVASIAQYFIKACVYICRHHSNEGSLVGFSNSLSYKLTYSLAKKIIVVSRHTAEYMTRTEKIDPGKIIHINLAYDFDLYSPPDRTTVERIRQAKGSSLLLVTAGRLNKYKRPELSVRVLKKLVDSGVNARLIILGLGENAAGLKEMIEKNGLTGYVEMPGYVTNVPDYLDAADFLVHPSIAESSCVVVKEAGLMKTPVIVCRGIGDFDDYIVHGENGFVVNKDFFVDECAQIIADAAGQSDLRGKVGQNLRDSVYKLFSVDQIIKKYETLNHCGQ
jgi:glycosyltransferase involved in cell wall biosynthesis